MPEIELGYSSPSEKKEEKEEKGKKNYRCEVKQISNGWLLNESWEEGGNYKSKEEYRKDKPIT